jgi:hypothetical protein
MQSLAGAPQGSTITTACCVDDPPQARIWEVQQRGFKLTRLMDIHQLGGGRSLMWMLLVLETDVLYTQRSLPIG